VDQQPTSATNNKILFSLITPFKLLDTTNLYHLFQNNLVPGPGTVVGDFVEATYDGYAPIAAGGFFGPLLDPVTNDWFTTPAAVLHFDDTGAVTPNTIYGFYMTDAGGTALVACQRFGVPVVMDAAGKSILISPKHFVSGMSGPDSYEN